MSDAKEHPCPDCGEMVRINSLRCWNCGAFMNSELEKKYLDMQAKPQEIIYSDLPQGEIASLQSESSSADTNEVDDDFELSMPTATKSTAVTADSQGSEPTALPSDPGDSNSSSARSKSSAKEKQASGGEDALFDIAMQDEREAQKQRRKRAQRGGQKTPGGGLIIFCPYGCRMVVKESHRGMQGKCPECKAPFIVPIDPPDFRKSKGKDEETSEAASAVGAESHWLIDLHLHQVSPEKLKLKADSLLKDFTLADFGFTSDQLIVAIFSKKDRSLFGGPGGKTDPREELKSQLQAGKKVDELTVAEKFGFSRDDLAQMKVVQPVASRADSIFHGIPVFGEGRVSIQLPPVAEKTEILYVSMGLTQFWKFKQIVEEKFSIVDLGENSGLPVEHTYVTHRCQYLETPVKALENISLYKVDDSVQLDVVGYQCGKCQIVVSEEGRKRENLGGKSPKGIAKAKCPKCSNKMGENLLYNIKVEPQETAPEAPT